MTASVTALYSTPMEEREFWARGLLADLEAHAPEVAAQRRAVAEQLGARWLVAVQDTTAPGEPVALDDAAHTLGRDVVTIRGWVRDGHVSRHRAPDGRAAVLLEECRAHMAARPKGRPRKAG